MAHRTLIVRAPLLLTMLAFAACGDDSSGTPSTDTDGGPGDADVSDGTVTPDTQADTTQPPDTAPGDTTPEEEVIVPGAFGAPCNSNAECESGYCVDGPKGYVCTRVCDTSCPTGYDCKAVSGGTDVVFLCLPRVQQDCAPCSQDFQCPGGLCLETDDEGRCAFPCLTAADCPDGFACSPSEREGFGDFCRPTTGSCSCYADADGGQRTCFTPGELGTCQGVSDCDPETGWGACSAPTPSPEVCNGRDDDCNGVWDDGLEDAGAPCENAVEGVGACAGTRVCLGTAGWLCQGPTPAPEVCNSIDDDCDGETDEGFRDAAGRYTGQDNCGGCGVTCTGQIPNATAFCSGAGDNPRCEVESCEAGYFQAGPLTCLPSQDDTCAPCLVDEHCGTPGDRCVPLDGGAYCGRDCGPGNLHGAPGECPAGFECVDFTSEFGTAVKQCVPTSRSCDCLVEDVGKARVCANEVEGMTCLGTQTCNPDSGWSACTARTPKAETCNGQDDNCNAVIDDVTGRFEACSIIGTVGTCPGIRDCGPNGNLVCLGQTPSAETCNGIDDDCNGLTDNIVPPLCPLQQGVCGGARQICAGRDGLLGCNAGNYGDKYEVVETRCDGVDNDCDGQTDEVDLDRDGQRPIECGGTDCDDTNRLVYAGAPEICGDAADNDCNGSVDDLDVDEDGWIAAACGGEDCNDLSVAVNPAQSERCGDRFDNDCDGSIDNKDTDADGYIDLQCGGLDCNDARADVRPGATEACDGIDNDCNFLIDEKDADADGFRDAACGGTDCDDTRPLVNPEGVEVCGNNIDENCSGVLNDRDIDADGFLDKSCLPFNDPNADCDDYDAQTYAGAPEVWDAKDNDCDAYFDEGAVPVGAVIVTEILGNPDVVADTAGEYFEVTNVSGNTVNLRGWRFNSDNDVGFRVFADLLVAPGAVVTFCANAVPAENGGLTMCAYEYGGALVFSNSNADTLVIELDSTVIDQVAVPASSTAARARVLQPQAYTSTGNDTSGNWCQLPTSATYDYDGGSAGPNYGTPGRINPGDCSASPPPGVAAVVPTNGLAIGGETVTLFGSGFAAGMTAAIGGVSCGPVIVTSAWQATCTTSAGTAGAANVTVTANSVTSQALVGGYTYTDVGNANVTTLSLVGASPYTIAAGLVGPIIEANVVLSSGSPRVEVGYGPGGTQPGTTPNWRWSPAILLPSQTDTFGRALVIIHEDPEPVTFAYAVRASANGVTWRYTTTSSATITP